MKKKIAILGASYLQLPLIIQAQKMDIETHCFAWDNAEAICKQNADFFYPISVLEKEDIYKKCKEIKIDGITTIATDIVVPTISYVANRMGLLSNTEKSAFLSTNKSEMRKAFNENNVNSPKSIATKTVFEKTETIELSYPLIVKPADRSGSRGVQKITTHTELNKAIERALNESIEKQAVIEEYIEGNCEVSVETISWQGNHYILAITDKVTTGTPYFVELEHHQPSALPNEIQEKIKVETIKALNALEIRYGASHAEFKIDKFNNVYAIEVGARMGGDFIGSHLVQLSTGYNFLEGVIQVALNNFNEPQVTENNYSGVYFLCKETEYLQKYFNEKQPFEIKKELLKTELLNITNSNDRSGYLIYKNHNKKIAFR